MRFSIEGESASPANTPDAEPVIYCDGAGSESVRPDIDLELSHWFPNRTPKRFAADTSTEICILFAASGEAPGPYDLVMNNHVDVDGVLSVFSLLEAQLAQRQRDTIVQAAEMGDFWGWGERPAQVLFQALVLCIAQQLESGVDAEAIYRRAFDVIRAVLDGSEPSEVQAGLEWLATCVERIESGEISRTVHHERFVHYGLPRTLAERDPAAALRVIDFGQPLSDRFGLLPHARARLDRERVALQSTECAEGWYYDLCYPGYVWAETPNSWRPPGLAGLESSNLQRLDFSPLQAAVADLTREETAVGRWTCAEELSPFVALAGRGFPVVLAFMDGDQPAASAIPPDLVAGRFASVFEGT